MARNKLHKPRVFCIGWHKSGTSTMGHALYELGYSVLGARLDMAQPLLNGNIDPVIQLAGQFDALQDVPWAALYKELDQAYPDSKFILTVRDEKAWLHSASKHFKDTDIPLHEWLYTDGVLLGNESLYLKRYRRHYREVNEYFKGRDDLLTMDLAKGDAWEKLCSFLDEPIPHIAFPHANKGKHNYDWKDKTKEVIRKLIPGSVRRARVRLLERMGLHHGRNRFNNAEANRKERQKRIK